VLIAVFNCTVVAAASAALNLAFWSATACSEPSLTNFSNSFPYTSWYTVAPDIAPSVYARDADVPTCPSAASPFVIFAPAPIVLASNEVPLANAPPTPIPVTANSPIDSTRPPPCSNHQALSLVSITALGSFLYSSPNGFLFVLAHSVAPLE